MSEAKYFPTFIDGLAFFNTFAYSSLTSGFFIFFIV